MVLLWIATKLVAIVLLLLGLFLVIFFPGIQKHQPTEFTKTGILMGLVFLVIGIYLIII